MELEIRELELKYARLRIADPKRQSQLAAALLAHGQQTPVVVVAGATAGCPYVLIDGYVRVAALQNLGRDLVEALVLPLGEPEALILGHRLEAVRRRSALEEAWLVRELIEGHGRSQGQLAIALQRSVSWVSRRLALVRVLPESVQAVVQRGGLSPQVAMRYLVPLARAKQADCEQLVAHLGHDGLSVRQMQRLYEGWRRGDGAQRARIVAHPLLYLRAQEEVAQVITPPTPAPADTDPLTRTLAGLSAFCRHLRRRVRQGELDRRRPAERERFLQHWDQVRRLFDTLVRLIETRKGAPPHTHGQR